MPMSPRLLRPRSTVHPEAQAWATRVIANGGTFGGSTLSAVSKFCRDIDATSGLRAAILRLNLFCGNDLNACLVPLYRAASQAASVIGNTTDTNNNFVSGDFASTGSSGGLTGNGSTKFLNTGFQPSNWSSRTDIHMSFSGTGLETSGDRIAAGAFNNTEGSIYALDIYAAYVNARAFRASGFSGGPLPPANFPRVTSPGTTESHFIGTRTANNVSRVYRDGTEAANNTVTITASDTTRPIYVFCLNSVGTAVSHTAARMRMYSIGNGLTAAQALAFSNAVAAFNTALNR